MKLFALLAAGSAAAFAPPPSARRTPAAALPRCAIVCSGLPPKLEQLIDPSVERSEVAPLWSEFKRLYANEAAALRAAERNQQVLLPFLNTQANIKGNWRVLRDKFSDADARDIITQNPGVLANKPGDLETCSADEIRRSVQFVSQVESIPPGIRALIPPATGILIVSVIAKRLVDCAGATCGY